MKLKNFIAHPDNRTLMYSLGGLLSNVSSYLGTDNIMQIRGMPKHHLHVSMKVSLIDWASS